MLTGEMNIRFYSCAEVELKLCLIVYRLCSWPGSIGGHIMLHLARQVDDVVPLQAYYFQGFTVTNVQNEILFTVIDGDDRQIWHTQPGSFFWYL